MEPLILKVKDIQSLEQIRKSLKGKKPLTDIQLKQLCDFLRLLPPPDNNGLVEKLVSQTPLEPVFQVSLLDMDSIDLHLDNWVTLFGNIPGFDGAPFSRLINNDNLALIKKGVVIVAVFCPTLADNVADNYCEVHLTTDGTAYFSLETVENAKAYPELFNFKGSWKEAYLLMIETLKKGWPLEEFPEELQKFIK